MYDVIALGELLIDFAAKETDEKGYCLVLLLWAAGSTPYSSAILRL